MRLLDYLPDVPLPPGVDYILDLSERSLMQKALGAPNTGQEPQVVFIGASGWEDLQGHIITKQGLECLATAPKNTTTYLEHKHDFEHTIGKLAGSPRIVKMEPNDYGFIKATSQFDALELTSDLDFMSPTAMRIHSMVGRDYKVGWSLGAHVEKGDLRPRKDSRGRTIGLYVETPKPVEWSSTMTPVNQQSWSLMAKSMLYKRGVLDPDDDDMDLIYAFRHRQDLDEADLGALMTTAKALAQHGIFLTDKHPIFATP